MGPNSSEFKLKSPEWAKENVYIDVPTTLSMLQLDVQSDPPSRGLSDP